MISIVIFDETKDAAIMATLFVSVDQANREEVIEIKDYDSTDDNLELQEEEEEEICREIQRLADKQRNLSDRLVTLQRKLKLLGKAQDAFGDKNDETVTEKDSNVATISIVLEKNEHKRTIEIEFKNNDDLHMVKVLALLDSNTPISFIQRKLVNPNHIQFFPLKYLEFNGIKKFILRAIGNISVGCRVNDVKKTMKMLVVKNNIVSCDIVLGRDFFNEFGLKIVSTIVGDSVRMSKNPRSKRRN